MMKNRIKLFSLCFLLIGSVAVATALYAAPGDLDLTFSQDGKLFDYAVRGGRDVINDIALQPDGKVVAVGQFNFGVVKSCAVARYTTSGAPDPSFGVDGMAAFPRGLECTFNSVAIQPDGKIVAAGSVSPSGLAVDFIVLRYNTDGSIDTSFSGDGIDIFFRNGQDVANGVVIQPDGKIILAGTGGGTGGDFVLLRYNPDGSLDSSFGSNGSVVSHNVGALWAVALQTDGKIVAAGMVNTVGSAARYNTNGTLDATFDGDGVVTFGFLGGSPRGIAIQPDGKIVLAGYGSVITGTGFPPPQNREMVIARLNTDGSFDPSFDVDGITTTTLPNSNDFADDVAIQPDGKIVIAGNAEPLTSPYTQRFLLARYNPDGSLDTSFNSGGVLISAQSVSSNAANGVLIQSDGKIIAAGFAYFCCGSWEDFALARFNPNGSPDSSFSSDGSVNHDVGFRESYARAVALQSNGKVVVAGFTANAGDLDFAVFRYNPDGSRDTSFSQDGRVVTPFVPGDDQARSVAVQSDGKIVVAGYGGWRVNDPPPPDAAVVRYNADGSLDTTFSSDGMFFLGLGQFTLANAVAIQPDGKIVVAAQVFSGGSSDAILFRLNANGSLDDSFDGDGVLTIPGVESDGANAIAIQPDGKIIAAGGASGGPNRVFVIVRCNPDGSLDTSFDLDGIATTDVTAGSHSEAFALTLQTDGKIVAGGYVTNGSNRDFALVRYNVNGSLDSSFDIDGIVRTTILSGTYQANAVAALPGGKILAAGGITSGFGGEFALARYNPDGSLDGTYNGDGISTFDFWGGSDDRLYGMAIDTVGRAVVVGEANATVAVARVLGDLVPNGRTRFDFEGDGKADIAVYRPSTGVWYQLFSSGVPYGSPTFGLATDIPVPADFDGDGKTDLAIYRPSAGEWWYLTSSTNQVRAAHLGGEPGDIPLPADINGDGTDDFVIFRPSNNTWYRITTTGTPDTKVFGLAGDRPLIGDFDGDGKADQAIFRPSSGDWWYSASSAGGTFRATHWGQNGDVPAPADYDGDGRTDHAIYRPSEGGWYIFRSSDLGYTILPFGISEDRPVPADYDGDGKADIAVFRPSTGAWYLLRSTSGFTGYQWGLSSDVAIPNSYIRP